MKASQAGENKKGYSISLLIYFTSRKLVMKTSCDYDLVTNGCGQKQRLAKLRLAACEKLVLDFTLAGIPVGF